MNRAPSDNVRRAAGAMIALARNGCVAVDRREELLAASGVPRGSWDRTVRALEALGVVTVARAKPLEGRVSSFVVHDARARDVSQPPDSPPVARESEPGPRARRATLRSQKTAQREETNNNNGTEPGEPSQAERASEPALTPLERMIAQAVAIAVGTAVREALAAIAPTSRAAPSASPGPTSPPVDVPPPEPCPVHGARVVAQRPDGVRFWGCDGWRSDHHCGTATVGLEAHARAVLAARATASADGARVERQRAEREDRMRGRSRGRDYSALDASQIKAAGGVARVGDLLAGVVLRTSTNEGGEAPRPEGGCAP